MTSVGFLCLGLMGARMALVLARSGRSVRVWNRSRDKSLRLLEEFEETKTPTCGAVVVANAAEEVRERCEMTFAMLADPKAARAVAKAYAGNDARAADGVRRTYVDCSTVDGAAGEETKAVMKSAGIDFLAAPVSGGWREAAKGELLFLCGGDGEAYDAASPHLEVMGAKKWLVGDSPTHAARAKLMLQIMMGNVVAALGEMHGLSERAGLDTDAVLEMLSHSAMGSPLTTSKGKLMRARNFSPNFQVYLQQKDLRLDLDLGDELEYPMPISAATNSQYLRAKSLGHANSDFSAVAVAYTNERAPGTTN